MSPADRPSAQPDQGGPGARQGRAVSARHERRGVDHDHGRPAPRMERLDHGRCEGVEVVRSEIGLAAGLWADEAEHGSAGSARRLAQAHPLAQAHEQAGDVLVAEGEVDACPGTLVALEDVFAAGTGSTGIRVVPGRLTDRDRTREGMAAGPGLGHAPVAGSAVGIAPAAALEAVQADTTTRMAGARRADRRDGPRGWLPRADPGRSS